MEFKEGQKVILLEMRTGNGDLRIDMPAIFVDYSRNTNLKSKILINNIAIEVDTDRLIDQIEYYKQDKEK